jgi:adenine-specific DNA-methyltransferase
MNLTDYHAKYFAYELTKRCSSDNVEKLVGALVDAQVDLNPHQVEAALFAFKSPLSKGALLADEVGLGKTIEAGLVIAQRWAERKRRILIITPANLRKQWHQEMQEKFFLPCAVLETRSYNEAMKRGNLEHSRTYLNRYERMLMDLTRYELRDHAEFVDGSTFRLKSSPFPGDIPLGLYELPRRSGGAHLYRLGHLLAEQVLQQAKSRKLPAAEISFDYSGYGSKISVLEPYLGRGGELLLSLFTVESLDQAEDYLLFAAIAENGDVLEEDVARRLLSLPATSVAEIPPVPPLTKGGTQLPPLLKGAARSAGGFLNNSNALREIIEKRTAAIQRNISERNARFFEIEAEKLDDWADDLKVALEREIKDIDRQIKEAKRAATLALTLEEKLAGQKQIKALESQRNGKRRALFDAQDEIDQRREKLIVDIEGKLQQKIEKTDLFTLRWKIM